MKKNILKITAIIMAIISITASASQLAFAENTEDEIIVEVIVGDVDEETIKNIQLDDGSTIGDHQYKILYTPKLTRDPAYMAWYFSQALWITRNGQISLSLKPLDEVRNSYSKKEEAWATLKGTTTGLGSHANWPKDANKVETFKWQYDCHFYFAKTKSEWNLEPWRTANSYAAVIFAGCNP